MKRLLIVGLLSGFLSGQALCVSTSLAQLGRFVSGVGHSLLFPAAFAAVGSIGGEKSAKVAAGVGALVGSVYWTGHAIRSWCNWKPMLNPHHDKGEGVGWDQYYGYITGSILVGVGIMAHSNK